MFLKKKQTKTNNFTKKQEFFIYPSKSFLHYHTPTLKKRNPKTEWYRKKKYQHKTFLYHSSNTPLDYYLVLSKHFANKGRKQFDIRVGLLGNMQMSISTWGLIYKRKIRVILPQYFLWWNYENLFGQHITHIGGHSSYVFHHFFYNNALIASSPGCYVRLVSKKKSGLLTFIFPSHLKKKTFIFSQAYVGRNDSIYWNQQNFYKAGNKKFSHKYSKVRGIAKNPVDHPNGGRSNTKGSFQTPWGKIAKLNK